MPATARGRRKVSRSGKKRLAQRLGILTGDAARTVRLVRAGFPFRVLVGFQKATELSWAEISRLVAIPQRTLTRRQGQARLDPDESDRVLRAARIFDMAVAMFEGDMTRARKWLRTAQPGLGGETPLDFASTEFGAREVENLLGRLEHGVFA